MCRQDVQSVSWCGLPGACLNKKNCPRHFANNFVEGVSGYKMKIGKKQIVLASLVLALGAAVYLNWQFSDNDLLQTSAGGTIGEAQLVNNQSDESVKNDDKDDKNGDSSNNGDSSSDKASADKYFADVRTQRQKSQDEALDKAEDILGAVSSDEAAKAKALESAKQIADIYQQQTNIESLIKAKGFSDCVAFIQNGECSIVLKKSEMNDGTNLVIKDIVNGQSGIEVERIKITGV